MTDPEKCILISKSLKYFYNQLEKLVISFHGPILSIQENYTFRDVFYIYTKKTHTLMVNYSYKIKSSEKYIGDI